MLYLSKLLNVLAWLLAFALPLSAEPKLLWSQPTGNSDAGTWASIPALLPRHGIAAVHATQNFDAAIAVMDLETGRERARLTPPIPSPNINALAMAGNSIAAVVYDGNSRPRRWAIAIYDAETLALRHMLDLPDTYPDHVPMAGATQAIASGDHLLVEVQEPTRTLRDTDPLMLHFDMATGQFLRAIGLAELDPGTSASIFGRMPSAPDFFFATAKADAGILSVIPSAETVNSRAALFRFNLDSGETLPPLALAPMTEHFVSLGDAHGSDTFIALTRPYGAAPTAPPSAVARLDPETGTAARSLTDPFDGRDTWFPETIAADGARGVASAPNASGGAGALVVFDTQTGTLLHTLTSPTPGRDLHFGRDFALAGDLLLMLDQNNYLARERAAQNLLLYRLD